MLPHGRTVGHRRNLYCCVAQYMVVLKQQASILCHRNVATCPHHAVIAGTVSAHQHGCSRIPQEKPDACSCTDLLAEVPFSKIGLPLQPRFRTVRHILRGEKEARFYACFCGTCSCVDPSRCLHELLPKTTAQTAVTCSILQSSRPCRTQQLGYILPVLIKTKPRLRLLEPSSCTWQGRDLPGQHGSYARAPQHEDRWSQLPAHPADGSDRYALRTRT